MHVKAKQVYQFLENTRSPTKAPRIIPSGIFVEVLDIGENGYAKCKVLHVVRQPKGLRFRKGQRAFFSVVDLGQPDLFPKLASKPMRWLESVNNPEPWVQIAQDAFEKGGGKRERAVATAISDAEGLKKFIVKEQIFKSVSAPTIKITDVTMQGNIEYKNSDRSFLKTQDEFVQFLVDNKYWTSTRLNWKKSTRTVWLVITPFVGILGSMLILKILEKRVLAS
jgi:hypothetical protein